LVLDGLALPHTPRKSEATVALETAANYPVYYAVSEDNNVANWRPLAHWAMAIPHLIVSSILNSLAQICMVISWFAILFTGKMPEGLANVIVMAQRYWLRTGAFYFGLTEQYPPFEFEVQQADPGNYAIRYDANVELEGRNRVTVFFRMFMMIPIMIFVYLVMIGVGIVAMVAWFAVLFTGTYPVGMRDFVIKGFRLGARMGAYTGLLTDQYPPFALE
jgi:hypothetical protein